MKPEQVIVNTLKFWTPETTPEEMTGVLLANLTRSGYEIVKPKEFKSTGKCSQNNHIVGHCKQIAEFCATKVEWRDYLAIAINIAVDLFGYPCSSNTSQYKIPKPYGDRTTNEEAIMIISALHEMANRIDLILIEGYSE